MLGFEEIELIETSSAELEEDLKCEEFEQENNSFQAQRKADRDLEVEIRSPLKKIENYKPGPSNTGCNVIQYRHFSPQQLENLLNKTVTGQNILKRGAAGPLSVDSQRELVQIIVEYHFDVGIQAKEEALR